MATATSNVFTFISDPIEILGSSIANVKETTAEASVTSNSPEGSIYYAIRTSAPYTETDLSAIVSGAGSVFWENRSAEDGLTTNFFPVNLTPGIEHHVGVIQSYGNNYFSAVHVGDTFKTASYPQQDLLPYQVSPYPDRYNYRDINVVADLGYGWGGDDPKTFTVNKLPAGLEMDSDGKVTGIPENLGTVTGINVTCTNAIGSREGLSTFAWVIDRLADVSTPTTGNRKRSELFEATRQYAEREDVDVEAMLPTMLTRANALLTRELRARNMSDRYFISIVEEQSEYSIPDDYELLENLKIVYEDGSTVTPKFVTSEQGNNREQNYSCYFTIENNSFRFTPALMGTGVIEVTYFKYIPYMEDDDSGNWLLDRWFDVYHNAMMVEVSAFVKDKEQMAVWKSLLDESLESAKTRTQRDMWTQPGLQIRTEY